MKAGDYKTFNKAQEYHQKRFKNGLEIVNTDEMKLLNTWVDEIHIKNKLILDLGTGTGRVVANLLNYKAKKIYALDESEAMLEFLTKSFNKETKEGFITEPKKTTDSKPEDELDSDMSFSFRGETPRSKRGENVIETINAPSDKIPLGPESIDLITAFHLLKHLPDIKPTLEQANKVLKPGGYFIFDILNINSLIRFNLSTCYALSEDQIIHALKQCGFSVREIIYLHPLGETIYDIFGKILSVIPKTLDGVIESLQLKAGTKIFVLAQKMKYE